MAARVTIKSIAKDLGLSHMTVSRALSGNPNVQKDTRERIEQRARELGYVKSEAARVMRGETTRIVGLLLPNIVNEFYARFANAMALACEAQSLHLIIHLTNDDSTQERSAFDRLREVQAMAVVMVPSPGDDPEPRPDTGGMRIIQLIRQRPGLDAHATILVEDHTAISDAVLHLARAGHRAIAYLGGSCELSTGRDRLAAYRAGLAGAGLAENPALIHMDAPSFDMGFARAGQLINEGRATGIVCGGVEISNGALSALMDMGLQPGRDMAFVGYGDPSFYEWIGGGLTTVRLPVEDLAQEAMALLDMKRETETKPGPMIHMLQATLITRQSISG